MNMVTEFMREDGFDFFRSVVVQQRVRENDPPRAAEPGESGICLLALLRKFPPVYSAHSRARPLPQLYQPAPKVFIVQRLELVENRQQHHRRKLSQQNEKSHEEGPRDQPPMLGGLANHEVKQLHHNRTHPQSHQKAFGFIPKPRAKFLRGELETSLQLESVVVKSEAQHFADQEQEE